MSQFQKYKNDAKRYIIEKNYKEALAEYRQALTEIDQLTQRHDISIVHLNIAICLYELGEFEKALEETEKALREDPTYFKIYYRKTQILLKLKHFAPALETVNQLMCKEPCKEVYDLKKTIELEIIRHSNIYDWELIKKELSQAVTEKEILGVFQQLHNRPEDLEAYHEILDNEKGFHYSLLSWAIQQNLEIQTRETSQILFLSLRHIYSIWSHIKKELKDKRFFIPYWLTQILFHNIKHLLLNKRVYKEQELHRLVIQLSSYSNIIYKGYEIIIPILQDDKLREIYFDKFLIDTLRLFSLNLAYCERCSPEEIKFNCQKYELLGSMIKQINQFASQQINLIYKQQSFKNQLDMDDEAINALWEIMIISFKISDCLSQKFQKFMIIFPDNYAFDFYNRQKLRKKDLILLIALVGTNNQKYKEKFNLYKVWNSILNTIKFKIKNISSIELIKQLLSLLMKDSEFKKELTNSPYANETNKILQDFLSEYKGKEETTEIFVSFVQYLSLLFYINSTAKFLDLYNYLVLINYQNFLIKLFKAQTISYSDSLNLLSEIVCFDDPKIIIIKNFKIFKTFYEGIQRRIEQIRDELKNASILKKMHLYSLSISLLSSREFMELQKERFGIDDEQYFQAKQLEKKSKPEGHLDEDQYFKYDEKFIQKHHVYQLITQELKIVQFISYFIYNFESEINNYAKELISQIMNHLSKDETLVEAILDVRIVRLLANISLTDTKAALNAQFYISRALANVNPNIFEYRDVHLIVRALLKSAQSAKHELQIFQSLLGVVQLSSLGEDSQGILNLQNFILEENNYIAHAALQIINNISMSEKFKQFIEQFPDSNFFNILDALLQAQFERLLKQLRIVKTQDDEEPEPILKLTDFSHPQKMISTIVGIIALCSYSEKFIEHNKQRFQLLKVDKFYNLIFTGIEDQIEDEVDLLYKCVCLFDNLGLASQLKDTILLLKQIFDEIKPSQKNEILEKKIQGIKGYLNDLG